MTITQISDREIALQAQLVAMTASRDEYQQAADKMAMEHKVERDTLRQHIKHIGNDALRSENHELRQQLAEAQRDAELGKTAMKFVDRAGDVHPGIDDAETICSDFYKAMVNTLDATMKGAA